MAIPSIRPGGWGPGFVPQPKELVALDSELATKGIDAEGGDTITGPILLQQSTLLGATAPQITGSVAIVGSGSLMGSGSAGTVTFKGTVPTFSVPRMRRVRTSMLEATRSRPDGTTLISYGNTLVIDPNTGGIYNYQNPVSSIISVPITKPMDGATVTSIGVYFYVPALPIDAVSVLLTMGSLTINFIEMDVTTGVSSVIGTAAIDLTAYVSWSQWYVGGAAQSLFITPLTYSMALSTYTYTLSIEGPNTTSVSIFPQNPVFTGMEINYTYFDERPTQ